MTSYYCGLRFRLGTSRYRLRRRDIMALHALQRIRQGLSSAVSPGWLLGYRQEIRCILELCPRAALSLIAATTRDLHTRKLAMWLRGLCGGTLGAPHLLQTALRLPPDQQAVFARAFQNMGAWAQLRELQQIPELVRRYPRAVRNQVSRPFSRRLARYVAHIPRRQTPSSTMPLIWADSAGSSGGRPAKPLWLIRLVLDRIRWLVSAQHSVDRLPEHWRGR
jgi:hypothetical protein